jgi:hypothetical protein
MNRIFFYYLVVIFFTSCSGAIKPEDLYGEWHYVKVLDIQKPSESTTPEELAAAKPSIIFTKRGDLIMIWGGKQLSKGKFRIEGKMIRYTENLPEGKTREFPFLVSELTKDQLVFETMEREGIRVTARK